MRIYIFKSERTKELRAFAGDAIGTKLPENHAVVGIGPWGHPSLDAYTLGHRQSACQPEKLL
jgi:hypothetical protein